MKIKLWFAISAITIITSTQLAHAAQNIPHNDHEEIAVLKKKLHHVNSNYVNEHHALKNTQEKLLQLEKKISELVRAQEAATGKSKTNSNLALNTDQRAHTHKLEKALAKGLKNTSQLNSELPGFWGFERSRTHAHHQSPQKRPILLALNDNTAIDAGYTDIPTEQQSASANAELMRKKTITAQQTRPQAARTNAKHNNQALQADHTIAARNANTQSRNAQGRPEAVQAYLQGENIALTKNLNVELDLTYSTFDRNHLTLDGFLALNAIFLGNINISEIKSHTLTLDLIGRYAVNPKVQLTLDVPLLYRKNVFVQTGVNGSSTATAEHTILTRPRLGDILTSAYVEAHHETPKFPGVIWSVELKFPSGRYPYGIRTETINVDNLTTFIIPRHIPTGDGLYRLSSGFSFTRTVDPAVIFGNIIYRHYFDRDFANISSNPGPTKTPGDIRIGDSLFYGMGIAYALNERTSVTLSFSQEISDKSRVKVKGGKWSAQNGSDLQPANFNTSFTYALSPNLAMIGSLQAGLNQDAADFQATIKFPYTFG